MVNEQGEIMALEVEEADKENNIECKLTGVLGLTLRIYKG